MNVPSPLWPKLLKQLAKWKTRQLSLDDLEWEIDFSELPLIEQIGTGEFGVVWLSRWKGKKVAVKQLRTSTLKQGALDEFTREMLLMRKLRFHENVVGLIGACTELPNLAIVAEYFPLGSLDKLIVAPDFEMDLRRYIWFLKSISAGLVYLHSNDIIHRDIACRNILVKRDERADDLVPKLTDFGMSRLSTHTGLHQTQRNHGPLKWWAPEALDCFYVKATDIWSLGVTMVELWVRGDPYPGESPVNVGIAVREGDKHPKLPVGLPRELHDIMLACWKYDPQTRPTAEELFSVLEKSYFNLKYMKGTVGSGGDKSPRPSSQPQQQTLLRSSEPAMVPAITATTAAAAAPQRSNSGTGLKGKKT